MEVTARRETRGEDASEKIHRLKDEKMGCKIGRSRVEFVSRCGGRW